jgi:hypothetical protein
MDAPLGTGDERGVGVAFGGDQAGSGHKGEQGSETHGEVGVETGWRERGSTERVIRARARARARARVGPATCHLWPPPATRSDTPYPYP